MGLIIRELDRVQLIVAKAGLLPGRLGTVVHIFQSGVAFEVEFLEASGRTEAVLTLTSEEVCLVTDQTE